MIDAVDLSMGAERQRQKEQLLAQVRAQARSSGEVLMTPGLVRQFEMFRDKVGEKAVNHCVDLTPREERAPANGGSGRPGGRGPAET
jgi:hypothetical protein